MAKALIDGQIIIAVDFDGTITTEGDMSTTIEMRPHCKRVLTKLKERGDARLILWTCRTSRALSDARSFLMENGMIGLFEYVNENIPETVEKYNNDSRKIGADYYIDDKNVLCGSIDWLAIEQFFFGESGNDEMDL